MAVKKRMESLSTVFSEKVEQRVASSGCTIMEAIVAECDEFSIDVEDVRDHLSEHLKRRLHAECARLHLVKGGSRSKGLEDLL